MFSTVCVISHFQDIQNHSFHQFKRCKVSRLSEKVIKILIFDDVIRFLRFESWMDIDESYSVQNCFSAKILLLSLRKPIKRYIWLWKTEHSKWCAVREPDHSSDSPNLKFLFWCQYTIINNQRSFRELEKQMTRKSKNVRNL